MSSASYFLVISQREALAWILRERRMAFGARRRGDAMRLEKGDELFLVTTRGCFHNPTLDRTRVIGQAIVGTQAVPLTTPVRIADREFGVTCDLELVSLSTYRGGLEVAPIVDRLDAFPKKHAWAMALRRALVPLPEEDARLVRELLARHAVPAEDQIGIYLASIAPVRRTARD